MAYQGPVIRSFESRYGHAVPSEFELLEALEAQQKGEELTGWNTVRLAPNKGFSSGSTTQGTGGHRDPTGMGQETLGPPPAQSFSTANYGIPTASPYGRTERESEKFKNWRDGSENRWGNKLDAARPIPVRGPRGSSEKLSRLPNESREHFLARKYSDDVMTLTQDETRDFLRRRDGESGAEYERRTRAGVSIDPKMRRPNESSEDYKIRMSFMMREGDIARADAAAEKEYALKEKELAQRETLANKDFDIKQQEMEWRRGREGKDDRWKQAEYDLENKKFGLTESETNMKMEERNAMKSAITTANELALLPPGKFIERYNALTPEQKNAVNSLPEFKTVLADKQGQVQQADTTGTLAGVFSDPAMAKDFQEQMLGKLRQGYAIIPAINTGLIEGSERKTYMGYIEGLQKALKDRDIAKQKQYADLMTQFEQQRDFNLPDVGRRLLDIPVE